jgi:hypothetical protein
LLSGADDNDYCENCWGNRFSVCDDCGGTFWTEDIYFEDDQTLCDKCHEQDQRGRDYSPKRFDPTCNTFERIDHRAFGVEIETDQCDDYEDYSGCFGAKPDGSINGKEFYSTILSGDQGLAEIDKLCQFADRHGWAVNDDCGLHIHFDMRDESLETLKTIAYAMIATYDVWTQFVLPERVANRYCKPCAADTGSLYSVTNWFDHCQRQHRYEWFNFQAYVYHTTYEIRLHHGSIDAQEISNWVRGISLWMAWAKRKGWKGAVNALIALDTAGKYSLMREVWQEAGCDDLVEWFDSKMGVLV